MSHLLLQLHLPPSAIYQQYRTGRLQVRAANLDPTSAMMECQIPSGKG